MSAVMERKRSRCRRRCTACCCKTIAEALLRRLQSFCDQRAVLSSDEGGEIRIRAKFDHAGFVAGVKLNLQMELFADARCKHALALNTTRRCL